MALENIDARNSQRSHLFVGGHRDLNSAVRWMEAMRKVPEYNARGYEFYLGSPRPDEIHLRVVVDPNARTGIWVSVPGRGGQDV